MDGHEGNYNAINVKTNFFKCVLLIRSSDRFACTIICEINLQLMIKKTMHDIPIPILGKYIKPLTL